MPRMTERNERLRPIKVRPPVLQGFSIHTTTRVFVLSRNVADDGTEARTEMRNCEAKHGNPVPPASLALAAERAYCPSSSYHHLLRG